MKHKRLIDHTHIIVWTYRLCQNSIKQWFMCFFYFFQYFIYLPFIPVWAFHSFQKWYQNETKRIEFYYFSKNFKPRRIRDVNLQRYAVNSKCQEYSLNLWTFPIQCTIQNSSNFWVKKSWNLTFHEKNQNLVLTVDVKSPIYTYIIYQRSQKVGWWKEFYFISTSINWANNFF